MSFKKLIRNYFTFGERDRLGIVAFVLLILVIYLLPLLFSRQQSTLSINEVKLPNQVDDSSDAEAAGNYPKKENNQSKESYRSYSVILRKDFTKGELFNFDPNELTVSGWQKLGLSEKTSQTIENYRKKGGRFFKPEDLNRIWGLPPGFFERVKDYIKIEKLANGTSGQPAKMFEKQTLKPLLLNINESDSAGFESLPGIGPRLAARIVTFRDKLGGFHDVAQIAETYGLPDSTFQKIRSSLFTGAAVLRKLSINNASKEELKSHPYLKWPLANAIIEYRVQHGEFKSLEELKRIALIDEVVFNKIAPYLSL